MGCEIQPYASKIQPYTQTHTGVEAILANDESSSDEELAEHLAREFSMRMVEAVEHVKRRDYLQRYLPPVSARPRSGAARGGAQ